MNHIEKKCDLGWEKCGLCNTDSHPELFTCAVCSASEGELTTDCPGRTMTPEERDLSFKNLLDYKDGIWTY